jgi:hypothetical protein
VITANVLAGGNGSVHPAGNLFPTVRELRAQFTDFASHDFRLPASAWLHAARDGGALGARLDGPTPR